MSKKRIPILEDLSSESKELFEILSKESNLACVLIGTNFLDQCLASMLKRYFVKDEKISNGVLHPTNGSIGTFSTRCDLAYLLGLINKYMYDDLKIIGDIRNRFAHSHLGKKFIDNDIQDLCKNLKYIEILYENPDVDSFIASILKNPPDKFVYTVSTISSQLLVSGLSIKHTDTNKAFVKHKYEKKD